MAKKLLSIITAGLVSLCIQPAIASEIQSQPQTPFYSLERIWILNEIKEEKAKTKKDFLESYLPKDFIPASVSSISLDTKVQRQVAYDAIRKFHEKVALEKSTPKKIPDKYGGHFIIEQNDGTKPLFDMISNPEKYLASLPEPEKSDFLYSELAKLGTLPKEKKELFSLRFGRLVPWEINYQSPELADKLVLHTLSEFYNNMILPGEVACIKKTKRNSVSTMFNRDILTLEEKTDYLQALNSCRIKR